MARDVEAPLPGTSQAGPAPVEPPASRRAGARAGQGPTQAGYEAQDLEDVHRPLVMRIITLPWRLLVAVVRDPRWLFGGVLLALALAAVLAPLIAPYDPLLYHPSLVAQPPTAAHLFGTDSSGRDVLSRAIYGTRISLSVGVAAVLAGGIFGTLLGMLAGYLGGWPDRLIGILTDSLLAFPGLILALALAASLGESLGNVSITVFGAHFPLYTLNVVLALAVVRIPVYTRLARAQTLQVRSLDYVLAARSLGSRARRILRVHVFPNIFSPLLVQATISISFAILDESVLSFLGLGAPPPTPEWGSMIAEAQPYLTGLDPWMGLGPVLAIVITVLSLNLFGDALRDKLDPRSADRGIRR
jgi:peptide/nickel transport system permease protein